MAEQQTRGMLLFSVLGVVFGALSFVAVFGEPWRLIGLGSAVCGLVIGNLGRKSPIQAKVRWSLAAIILSVAGAAACFAVVSLARAS